MSDFQRESYGTGTYGRAVARKFGIEDAPAIVTRSLLRSEIAVTEILVVKPPNTLSEALPQLDAYTISLELSDLTDLPYFEDERHVAQLTLRTGETTIHDLRRRPGALVNRPLHSLLFSVPTAAFHAIADQAEVPRIEELRFPRNAGIADETIKRLGYSLLPSLASPDRASQLFVDHVMMALTVHAAQTYGGMQSHSSPQKGGLAPWQERLAKEIIVSDLAGQTSLQEIAKACGLSVSHFSRAFRASTGLAPYAYLLKTRVERAKTMLRDRNMPMNLVAESCGFVDRSHFTRVFTRRVGLSPGAWRRATRV